MSVVPSSLFRFKHPSEGELCALAGKQMPKQSRRDRWERGRDREKSHFCNCFNTKVFL